MSTEYWLQRKTIGGWSVVTWYDDKAQAELNYSRLINSNKGYSYRLVQVDTLKVDMLDEVVEVEAPGLPEEPAKPKWGNTWGTPIAPMKDGDTAIIKGKPWAISIPAPSEHGMVGKVWLIHHGLKLKKRVDPSEVDAMIAQGYERGGPKTQFRE